MSMIQPVTLIGAGNVATHMGLALKRLGVPVVQVWSRSEESGSRLSRRLRAGHITDIGALIRHSGLYLLSVPDHAIPDIVSALRIQDGLLAHTAGSMGLSLLEPAAGRTGVFYPLQTFRKERRQSWKGVPVCVEAKSPADLELLSALAKAISGVSLALSAEQRRQLHLAAVFASNFPNFLYVVSEMILKREGLQADLLLPLVRQTSLNLKRGHLFAQQTGPALRKDNRVLDLHRELLANDTEFLRIYNLMTESIIQYQRTHGKL